ncbi:hypothetical protein CY34DRAFT_696631 [Suillus luteus UH-Slu-Lm8-n1]|uniref:Uncharacterized protein n=1 Tax=Suillus luteus UH-Slu-Lm8-n1 TaxID=930992 RepID=A0A0C9Z7R3_9AGAM|nr:hypothetical protein CY34DRAFT_696631 [Suillus luteus UH-Slu-Lm8-n1]
MLTFMTTSIPCSANTRGANSDPRNASRFLLHARPIASIDLHKSIHIYLPEIGGKERYGRGASLVERNVIRKKL